MVGGLEESEALEEIICDQMGEILHDEEFLENVADEHPDLARAILSAVRNVLRKIRELFAEYGGFPSKYNNAMLSQLDLLKEAENLLCSAIDNAQAKRNDEILNQYNTKYSIVDITLDTGVSLGKGVYLDDTFLDGLSEYEQKKIIADYVDSLSGKTFSAFDNNETEHTITIPSRRKFKRVKDGKKKIVAANRDLKLKYSDDVIRRKSLSQIDEVIVTSNFEKDTPSNYSHGWLDDDGKNNWSKWKTYIVDKDNSVYEMMLAIANSADSDEILYDFWKPKKIGGCVSVASQPINDSLTDYETEVKRRRNKFSLSFPIEETKDLIALHNIEESNFIKTLDLGGFPMPSIAITKAALGHTKFGKISVLFSKDTIDPSVKENKVFGADAWTPTFPNIEYEINKAKSEKIYARANKVNTLPFFNPVTLHPDNIEAKLNTNGSEAGIIEEFKNDYGLKQMYLVENGKSPVKIEKIINKEEMPEADKEIAKWYLENEKQLVESLEKIREANLNLIEWKREHSEDLKNAYARYFREELGFSDEKIENLLHNTKLFEFVNAVRNALRYKTNEGLNIREEDDIQGAKEKIDSLVNQEDYEAWVNELFKGIEGETGLWNGKAPYTATGNRRSFKQLHYPVTTDNIVKAMLSQSNGERNSTSVFVGTKTIRAAATEKFKSINEIKQKSAKKLKAIETEEYDALKKVLDERLSNVIHSVLDANPRDNEFIAADEVGLAIEEACVNPTVSNIKETLKKYSWNISTEQAEEIQSIINEIADMPASMFEAKPERVVGFDEIKLVVLPQDSSKELLDILNNKHIKYVFYDGTDADRIKKVNSEAEENSLKFSFGGVNAEVRVGQKTPLRIADEMRIDGKPSEEIRKKTGWFQGLDGKWRFEIDDSKMRFRDFYKEHPDKDVRRHRELENKMLLGNISAEEWNELRELAKKPNVKEAKPTYLSDYIEHDELFKAYPQLQYLTVKPQIFEREHLGSYIPSLGEILINASLLEKGSLEDAKSVLIHEIQHAIQCIEGFAIGGNIENDSNYYELQGEIEARDAGNRVNLTPEERENIRPDIDREIAYGKFARFSIPIPKIEAFSLAKHKVRLNKRDYAIIKKEVIRKNANMLNENGTFIDHAYTDSHFVMYVTFGDDSFIPFIKKLIKGNEEEIRRILYAANSPEERNDRSPKKWGLSRRNNHRHSNVSGDRRANRSSEEMDLNSTRTNTSRSFDKSVGNSESRRKRVVSEDEIINFSLDNDLYDPFLDGDISDKAKSRRVKVRASILAEIENLSLDETKLSHGKILDTKAFKPKLKELVEATTNNSDMLPMQKRELLLL